MSHGGNLFYVKYVQVVKYVRAIREGLIMLDKPKEEPHFYLLWGDDMSQTEKARNLSFIPTPKPKLPGACSFHCLRTVKSLSLEFDAHFDIDLLFFPFFSGHEESYNPSLEYIPTQEEINSFQLMYEEDCPKFIPRR